MKGLYDHPSPFPPIWRRPMIFTVCIAGFCWAVVIACWVLLR